MLDDLDRLMAERELDWLVVRGSPCESPDVHFLVRGASVGDCVILKHRGDPPTLVVGSMERDEARASGLEFSTFLDFGSAEIAREKITLLERQKKLFVRILEKKEVRGRTSFCGRLSVQAANALIAAAVRERPEIQFVEEPDKEAILEARESKAPFEVERIRDVGRRTEEVVLLAVRLVASCREEHGVLLKPDGAPLKIGDVKDLIALELARRGLDDHGETIFAAGREAGFPHSRGTPRDPVLAGKPIIFDIFPQEKGAGYYFDFTRTLWVGDPSPRVRAAFEAVDAAFEAAVSAVHPGRSARDPDLAAIDALEARGFVTRRQDMRTEVGYCHGLGHGLGLEIHERPSLNFLESNRDVLGPGMVFTIEPGVYHPEEELGIRLEDTFYLRPDGKLDDLATLPRRPDALLARAMGQ